MPVPVIGRDDVPELTRRSRPLAGSPSVWITWSAAMVGGLHAPADQQGRRRGPRWSAAPGPRSGLPTGRQGCRPASTAGRSRRAAARAVSPDRGRAVAERAPRRSRPGNPRRARPQRPALPRREGRRPGLGSKRIFRRRARPRDQLSRTVRAGLQPRGDPVSRGSPGEAPLATSRSPVPTVAWIRSSRKESPCSY